MKIEQLKNQVQRIACPVCFNSGSRFWRTVRDWTLERCPVCSMTFANPCPDQKTLELAYGLPREAYQKYFQSAYIDCDTILGESAEWQRDLSIGYLRAMENKRAGKKGRLLDIGCGSGALLEVAQEMGWETTGVDYGDWRQDSLRDDRLNIYRGSLQGAGFENESFDVVFMGSVLEHLSNPTEYLEIIRRLLKNNGILYIVGIPNINSWTILLRIDRWLGNHPPGHLLFFSDKTIELILRQTGFSGIKTRSYGISETVLEAIFNRKNTIYSGEYAGLVHEKSMRGQMFKVARSLVYSILDLARMGSVLEVMAIKN